MAKNKIPTAEEHFKEFFKGKGYTSQKDLTEWGIEFAKLHVKAALREAHQNAEITCRKNYNCKACYGGGCEEPIIAKDSIINVYPLNNIK